MKHSFLQWCGRKKKLLQAIGLSVFVAANGRWMYTQRDAVRSLKDGIMLDHAIKSVGPKPFDAKTREEDAFFQCAGVHDSRLEHFYMLAFNVFAEYANYSLRETQEWKITDISKEPKK